MTEPMTAAEYREMTRSDWGLTPAGRSILAALEEREALLVAANQASKETAHEMFAEATQRNADAALGALVRRIREHPAFTGGVIWCRDESAFHFGSFSDDQLSEALSHLDSLLPNEPEVVTGPSGVSYRVKDGEVQVKSHGIYDLGRWNRAACIPAEDAPVVAKLMVGAK